jgi:hypothetical protein
MIREFVSAPAMVRKLNELATLDPHAMYALVEHRVPVNEDLANHPTMQVSIVPSSTVPVGASEPARPRYIAGMLGVLNAVYGLHSSGPYAGSGAIVAHVDDEAKTVSFSFRDYDDALPSIEE